VNTTQLWSEDHSKPKGHKEKMKRRKTCQHKSKKGERRKRFKISEVFSGVPNELGKLTFYRENL